ncbi:FtsB family cell division protein [Pseudoramibacter sp.]|jgi:cell division protein FtsB|uniref:FtsB family cell division protein n=1 Tax=Pseudoramibacter sp. TaxID=2034862 RepID=UPI0025D428E3|nr:septum formation initiator family protein [Pseudoramibacter sp.]MCH4071489.1 septum formation initiator family protein [Pseudoramibacter sp.]MCH4105257.1 septum formation initiator family protein [Pseudoramibacter sp.]
MAKHSQKRKRRLSLADWLAKNGIRLIVMIAIVAVVGTLYGTKITKIVQLEAQKKTLEAQLVSEHKRAERLDNELKSIKSRHYVEYIAHKNLGLVYPDEQIVIQVKSQKEAKKKKQAAVKQAKAFEKEKAASQSSSVQGVDQ